MRILVTNDDGVDAPGLLALKCALDAVGETLVVAPEHNWSAAGHRKTMHSRYAWLKRDWTMAHSPMLPVAVRRTVSRWSCWARLK